MISTFSTASKGSDRFKGITDQFKSMTLAQQKAVLASKALDTAQKEALASSAGLTIAKNGQVVATEAVAVAEGEAAAATGTLAAAETGATATTGGLSAALSGLWATLAPVLTAIVNNPLTWAIAIGAAAVALEDFLTVDYDEAHEALDASTEKYQETQSSLESLNSELENTKSRISELQALKDAGTITLAEDAELESLQAQNDELEHQIELKQQLADVQSQEAIADAKEAAEKKSHSVAQSIRAGDSKGEKDFKGTVGKVTDQEAIKEDIKLLSEYKDKRSEAQDSVAEWTTKLEKTKNPLEHFIIEHSDLKNAQEELDHYSESIETLYTDLGNRSASIQSELDVLKLSPTENAKLIRELESSLREASGIDLTPKQKQLKQIESFFNGSASSNTIRDQLMAAAKSGESATDALHRMGITLNDLGITGKEKKAAFDEYFNGLVQSAQDAQDAIKAVDGTVEGVKAAMESENQDQDWSDMASALSKAQELYKAGKVGTDDFKTATQFMTYDKINPDNGFKYDADAYVKYWEDAQGKVARYFDANNPLQSVLNFSNDLVDRGLATKVGDEYTWGFKNSAQAAKELGLSVEGVETLMHSLESYGAEFDGVLWSGEGLEEYKGYLEDIQNVLDSTDDKQLQERFQGILDQAKLDDLENNIENLTPEIIADLQFEADLASLQQAIDDIQNEIGTSGGTAEQWGSLVAAEKGKRDKLASQEGMSTATSDQGYIFAGAKVDNLAQDLITKYDTLGEKGRREIAMQQDALVSLQNSFLEMNQTEPMDWDKFMKTDQANDIIKQLADNSGKSIEEVQDELSKLDATVNDEEAKKKLDGILSVDGTTITMNVDASTEQIENQLNKLEQGQTLKFNATLNGQEGQGIQATKQEDGTIRYTAVIDDVEQTVARIQHQDGTIEYDSTINSSNIDEKMAELENGSTIKFTADVDGVEEQIEAVKEEDGTITYKVESTGEELDLTDKDQLVKVKVDADTADAEEKIGAVASYEFTEKVALLTANDEATPYLMIWNELSMDPKFSSMTASDQASYVVAIWNALTPEQKEAYLNGEITVTDNGSGTIETVDNKLEALPNLVAPQISVHDNSSSVVAGANSNLNSINGKTVHTYIVTHKETKGGSDLAGTAHKDGTLNGLRVIPKLSARALAMGTLENTDWLKSDWKTQAGEVALTGELGQELVVHGNRWWTVGDKGAEFASIPKGSVVFDAEQTKELLTKGSITGRGSAYLSGSAYANGFRVPSSSGSSGSGSKRSATKSSGNSGNSGNSNNGNSDTKDDFEEIKDWVEVYLKRQERITSKLVDAIDDAVGLVDKQSATNAAIAQVQAEIAANQNAINTYKNKANSVELASNYKNQVINGTLNIETIKDEDLKDKIEDFTEWHEKMLDCEDTIDDLKDKLKDLAKQKFDNVTKEFENQIDLIKHETDMIDAYIDQIEERGYLVSTKLYDQMIAHEKDNLSKLQSEYDNLTTTLQDLLDSGLVTKYSDQWYEMMGDINDVTEAIVESNTAIIKYQNSIRDIKWDVFDKLQERISAVKDESDFLIDLMSHEKMYDSKTGDITKYGQATLGLHAVNYNTLMAQADEYGKEIAEIEKQLEVDPNNLTLVERYNDLIDKQRDAITGAKDAFKDAIDLIQDGFDSFLDAMDKAIQKRKDELSAAKDLYDYEKQIAEHTKEIGNLEKQLNAYKGDDSEEARKTIQELKNSLEDAKNNLNETEYERYISDQEQMLDNLYDDAEEWINQRLDDNEWLLNQLIKYTNDNAGSIQETINGETNSVGYRLSEAMKGIWDTDGGATKVVGKYAENFSSLLTTTNEVLEKIRGYIAKMVGESDKKAEETVKDNTPAKQPEETPKPAPAPTPPKQNTSGGDGVPRVGDAVTYTSGNYYYSSDGVSPLGNMYRGGRVYITSINNASWATKPYHISTGSTLGNGDLGWVSLSQLVGYKTGGLVDDTGVAMLHGSKQHPEMVLNAKDTEAFMDLTEVLRRLASRASNGLEAIDDPFSNLDISVNPALNIPTVTQPGTGSQSTNIENHFNIDFNLPNVHNADELISELQRNNRFEKVVQSMTLGAMTGKNSMDKYRY